MTLDGPFTVFAHDPITRELTDVPAPGVHYKTDTATLSAHPELAAYVVTPTDPLQSVWAGDNPAGPQWTVSLRFVDQAAADLVIGQLVPL